MTPHQTKGRHVELHRAFDELLACFYTETNRLAGETTVMEFLEWSHAMTVKPTCATVEKEDEVGS